MVLLSYRKGKIFDTLITVLNTNSSKVGHSHDDRYYTESEITSLLTEKLGKFTFSWRYGKIENQSISTGSSVADSDEPAIPFDCYVLANHHLTLKSTARNAKVYWYIEGAYIQGFESWDGTVSPEYAFDKTFIYEAKAGQTIQMRLTDSNGVGIVSRGNNNSLNRHSFMFIPK